jgi:hypothetical protein
LKKVRNKFERKTQLFLRRQKIKFEYETEKIAYVLCRHYIPDFIIYTPLGKIYVECKGYLRPEDRAKLLAVKRQNPGKDIRILFYREVKTQIRWAEKNGFRYSISEIPLEWLEGL